MGLLTLSARHAAALRRIRRRAWTLIFLLAAGQGAANAIGGAQAESAGVDIAAPAHAVSGRP